MAPALLKINPLPLSEGEGKGEVKVVVSRLLLVKAALISQKGLAACQALHMLAFKSVFNTFNFLLLALTLEF